MRMTTETICPCARIGSSVAITPALLCAAGFFAAIARLIALRITLVPFGLRYDTRDQFDLRHEIVVATIIFRLNARGDKISAGHNRSQRKRLQKILHCPLLKKAFGSSPS